MKNINIRMSYDTSADIEKLVESTVQNLYIGSMIYKKNPNDEAGNVYTVDDLPLTYKRGWIYRVGGHLEIENYYPDGSSCVLGEGDLIIANIDRDAVESFTPGDWHIIQGNIEEPIDDKYIEIINGNF